MMTPQVEQFLKLADSRSLDVLFWLLETRNENNMVYTTLESVAKECCVTKVTVNRVFQRLYKEGYMTKIRNGQYKLHKI